MNRRVEQVEVLPEPLIRKFWPIYDQAFDHLKTASPCRQYLLQHEFEEEMRDPRILKFVLRDHVDEPVAMAFVATDLTAIPWISPPYFAGKFPEEYAAKTIFYFGALLAAEDRRAEGHIKHLLAVLINFVFAHKGVAAFDHCMANKWLPLTIRDHGEVQGVFEMHELDRQTYRAYKAVAFNEGFSPGNPFKGSTQVVEERRVA